MRSDRGGILIVTFWTLLVLSVLASGIAFRLSMDMRLSRYFLEGLRAQEIAMAGVYRAMEMLSNDEDDYDSLYECGIRMKASRKPQDFFNKISLGEGNFTLEYKQDGHVFSGFSDEDRKINLNTAGENVLISLLTVIGEVKDPFAARDMAVFILDWRDADHVNRSQKSAEDDYYRSLPQGYDCADRPFRTTEELLLVKDMTQEIYDKISEYITVYGEESVFKINLNTASIPVLHVIGVSVGMQDENAARLAQRIAEWRSGSDNKPGTADDAIFTASDIESLEKHLPDLTALAQANLIPVFKSFFKSYSSYYRIESAGSCGAIQKKITVVTAKNRDKGQSKFIYYHQD